MSELTYEQIKFLIDEEVDRRLLVINETITKLSQIIDDMKRIKPLSILKEKLYDANRWAFGEVRYYNRNRGVKLSFVHWNEVCLKDCRIRNAAKKSLYEAAFKNYFNVSSDTEKVKITKEFVNIVQNIEFGEYKRLSEPKFKEYFGNGKVFVKGRCDLSSEKEFKHTLAESALKILNLS